MDDIATELGISKKTIYQFFKDKDEIVYQVVKQLIEMDRSEFESVCNNAEDAIDELVQMSMCLRKNITKVNPSLLYDIQKYHPRSWALWMDFKHDFIKQNVFTSIEKGKKEGMFREEIEAEILATFRIQQVEMAFDNTIFPRKEFEFAEVQMALFDHFVHGLLTVKGQENYEKLLNTQENA